MQPKELIYQNKRIREVIADDYHKGVHYICVNIGDHPRAYVECTREFLDRHHTSYGDIPGINVHGGVSWTGSLSNIGLQNYTGVWFGWSYDHAGDWTGHMTLEQNTRCNHRKYTTMDLITDCKDAVKQYLNMLDADKETDRKGQTVLTPEYLRGLGFQSVIDMSISGSDTTMYLSGKDGQENKWKIYIDFKNPVKSYVYNQNPRRRYEGVLTQVIDLKLAVRLCHIPIKID